MPSQTHLWAASSHNPWQAGIEGLGLLAKPNQLDKSEMEARRRCINPEVLHLSWCQDSGITERGKPSRNRAAKLCWTFQEAAGIRVKL